MTKHYSIIKDLAYDPCAMSALEVLQSCPAQHKALLSTIDSLDPMESSLITFDIEDNTPCLSHKLMFQIQVMVMDKLIH